MSFNRDHAIELLSSQQLIPSMIFSNTQYYIINCSWYVYGYRLNFFLYLHTYTALVIL